MKIIDEYSPVHDEWCLERVTVENIVGGVLRPWSENGAYWLSIPGGINGPKKHLEDVSIHVCMVDNIPDRGLVWFFTNMFLLGELGIHNVLVFQTIVKSLKPMCTSRIVPKLDELNTNAVPCVHVRDSLLDCFVDTTK